MEMETEELVRRGMEPAEARREALRRFGGVERTKERVRDERGGRILDDLVQDLRYGMRTLRKSPGFAASALLILALGIGSASALFGVVDAVLLEPLPYPDSERLVRVWPVAPARGVDRGAFSYPDFQDWRERASSLSGLALYTTLPSDYPYLGGENPTELSTAWVAGDFFQALEVAPELGRTIRPDDVEEGRQVLVLSNATWQRLYGGDPSVVGRTITLDYRSFEVVGVMPPGFGFPGAAAPAFGFPGEGEAVDIWVPLTVIPEDDIPIQLRPVRFLQAVGRLAPGATPETSRQELSTIAAALEETYPDSNAGVSGATVLPLRDWIVGDVRTALWVVLGAVGFILLLACANVANLLLARGTARAREVALRMSLGASAGRVTRQLLTESLLLGAVGGVLGVALAWSATGALMSRSAGLLPRATEVDLDATVLAASFLVTLVATALAGVLPALRATDLSPSEELKEGSREVGGGASGVRLRRTLVAAEVALAVVLLTGAGLMVRSLGALNRVDPGFDTDGRIAMTLTISDMKHTERAEWLQLYRDILGRLEEHPDVVSAGAIRYLPFRGTGEAWSVQVPGLYEPTPEEQRYAQAFQVSEDLFRSLGMTLLRGRGVRATDGPEDPYVVVVNEAFQREFFRGEDPVGRRVIVGGGEIEVQVVGVVADVHHRGLDEDPRPTVYVRNEQVPRIQMSYVVHTGGDPLALVDDMRQVVRQLDPDQTITEFVPLRELTAQATARPRFFTLLLGGFALMALVLAALGVYGVLSYVVRSRAREMGLRLALGASAERVLGHVLVQGLVPVAAGLVAGIAGAAGLSRFLETLLFGVEALDPVTYGAVALVLGTAATTACFLPAWSATRVDPMESLRAE
ncbi:MAG: FtsX-like permease family protein [Gemmatimonadetes bacterium]|nr:ABC transporter permease [Gemmatimonadota bacterium]NIR79518.1 ABC transporter permease [Gemmatimonadota bacterium]NIT88193.1 ABC transporter permease [Gemmatimonadota bacterium]NIU32002.1 ABC transporter permease [Gemmatimonadota bacterium]NIU36614.1 FtsX-like permease family protein [Gemmatimonadota bacterium]